MSYPKLTPIIAKGATEPRYLEDRFADVPNPKDFGAKGDGNTNDSAAFVALETIISNRIVDLCGYTYAVDSVPDGNLYYNGSFVVNGTETKILNNRILIKEGVDVGSGVAGNNCVITGDVPTGFNAAKHRVIAIGTKALDGLDSSKSTGNVIGIGDGVMSEGHPGNMNIGIGTYALHNNNASNNSEGDRNVAVGTLSLFGLTTGRCNTGLGRDTGQTITSGSYNTCVGYFALSGIAPICLDGSIHAINLLTGSNNTCVGRYAGATLCGSSSQNTVLGSYAFENAKFSNSNTVIGTEALRYVGRHVSINQKNIIEETISGTYSQTGTVITITANNHSAVLNRYIRIKFTSGDLFGIGSDEQHLYVTEVSDSSVFSVESPVSMTASGNCEIYAFEQDTDSSDAVTGVVAIGEKVGQYADICEYSVLIGNESAQFNSNQNANSCEESVVIGYGSLPSAHALENSILIGYQCLHDYNLDNKIENCISIGSRTGLKTKGSSDSVFIGSHAGNRQSKLEASVGIGRRALYSGSETSDISNAIAIGYGSNVTGSNQAQIGNSNVTTYVYGSVQDRSDARDKTDIRDTILGLDFLLSLRPVDFKWDYREDYIDIIDNKNGDIETVVHKKDGSRKRNRFHHGLIAQEVKAVLDEKDIDFGGYQDHSINGGKDVLTLGYEEFVAPMIKAIQELNNEIVQLKEQINQLTNPNN